MQVATASHYFPRSSRQSINLILRQQCNDRRAVSLSRALNHTFSPLSLLRWCSADGRQTTDDMVENEIDYCHFDQCVRELEDSGFALLHLPRLIALGDSLSSISKAFRIARSAMNVVSDDIENRPLTECDSVSAPVIDPCSDSGSWTGFHRAALNNGRYNEFREGFVFSNGEVFDIDIEKSVCSNGVSDDCGEGHSSGDFFHEMNHLFQIMHNIIAEGVLRAIERRMELPHLYFTNELGPTDKSSQWHVKRYIANSLSTPNKRGLENQILLPAHTDPSLISVVILDHPGVVEGAMGLEIFQPKRSNFEADERTTRFEGEWKELPSHGHDVAIIFIGSVFSILTKGKLFPPVKHRVTNRWSNRVGVGEIISKDSTGTQRVAVTLFVRPRGDALLKPIPSCEDNSTNSFHQTFRQWNSRVAKNYMKPKQKRNAFEF